MAVAPFHVHLCTLNPDKEGVTAAGESLYSALTSAGVDALYDDRVASPGVKFNDADLIGIPIRLTVSPRTLGAGGVEMKRRNAKDASLLKTESVVDEVTRMVREELAAQGGAQS